MRTLSKSDLKVALDCPTKLYYRKQRFPSTLSDNDYLKLLAEGGYAVGLMAQLQHPGGIDLGGIGNGAEAAERTRALLAQEEVTLFEAAFLHDAFLVRVDILVKRGDRLELIEVKSKGIDGPHELEDRDWQEYLDDVAYQTGVVRLAAPGCTVEPYLLVPDKTKRTAIDGLNGLFRISRGVAEPGGFQPIDVRYTGDVEALRAEDLLIKLPVHAAVEERLPTLMPRAVELADSLNPTLQRIATPIGLHCASCEYRGAAPDDPARDGFRQCWGPLADAPPTVLDLYRAGNLNTWQGGALDDLIAQGRVGIADVPDSVLVGPKPEKPYFGGRPLMQKHQRSERIDPALRAAVQGWSYPLHFIDFETSRMALPYHRGMRPWEQIGFQWSCHTIAAPDAEPTHAEWLNTEEAFPSFAFARSLMEHIGEAGTVLTWSGHENTVLRDIRCQMDTYTHADATLARWLDAVVRDKDRGLDGRLTDMNALAVQGYFHPDTKGRTSIKYTLPAVLKEQRSPRIRRWLEQFGTRTYGPVDLWATDDRGVPLNPYGLLPAIELIDGYAVREGTGAMTAYADMLYGELRDRPEARAALSEALRLYCRLDTLAMVIIWEHWRG
ncbi:MAG: DUF2779 domain-containing protein [Flavobacteriales bacterium]